MSASDSRREGIVVVRGVKLEVEGELEVGMRRRKEERKGTKEVGKRCCFSHASVIDRHSPKAASFNCRFKNKSRALSSPRTFANGKRVAKVKTKT